jgi:hypothetical protein
LSMLCLSFRFLHHGIRNTYLILLIVGNVRHEGVKRINEW